MVYPVRSKEGNKQKFESEVVIERGRRYVNEQSKDIRFSHITKVLKFWYEVTLVYLLVLCHKYTSNKTEVRISEVSRGHDEFSRL